jgi:alkylhydroperoxidase family enzyme
MARIAYPARDRVPSELAAMLAEMPKVAPIEMLAHSPRLAQQFLRMAQAQFTELELSLRNRELLILTVAAHVECEYEYRQHIPISLAAGIKPALRVAIWGQTVNPDELTESERVLLGFIGDVLASPRVSDNRMASVATYFTEREIVEILQLVGFYWGFGRLCTVLEVEIETPSGLTSVNAVANLSGG